MVLLNQNSFGKVAINWDGDGFYSDFYLKNGSFNSALNRLNEFKNQRFYLNALTSMVFYQRYLNFTHTYAYVGVKELSSGINRTNNIANCEY